MRLRALRHSLILAHYLKLNASDGRCGVPAHDVPMPPLVPPIERKAYLASADFAEALETTQQARQIECESETRVPMTMAMAMAMAT